VCWKNAAAIFPAQSFRSA